MKFIPKGFLDGRRPVCWRPSLPHIYPVFWRCLSAGSARKRAVAIEASEDRFHAPVSADNRDGSDAARSRDAPLSDLLVLAITCSLQRISFNLHLIALLCWSLSLFRFFHNHDAQFREQTSAVPEPRLKGLVFITPSSQQKKASREQLFHFDTSSFSSCWLAVCTVVLCVCSFAIRLLAVRRRHLPPAFAYIIAVPAGVVVIRLLQKLLTTTGCDGDAIKTMPTSKLTIL